jgi:hypothetical protein
LYFEKKANRILKAGLTRQKPKFANLTQYAWAYGVGVDPIFPPTSPLAGNQYQKF